MLFVFRARIKSSGRAWRGRLVPKVTRALATLRAVEICHRNPGVRDITERAVACSQNSARFLF